MRPSVAALGAIGLVALLAAVPSTAARAQQAETPAASQDPPPAGATGEPSKPADPTGTGETTGDGSPAEKGASSAPEAAAPDANAEAMRQRAARIRALLDGTLDPSVPLEPLFAFDLASAALSRPEHWREVLDGVGEPPPKKPGRGRARKAPPAPEPSPEDATPAQALRAALNAFLRLDPDLRTELLTAHRTRGAALAAAERDRARMEAELSTLQQRADQLAAFLEGRLALDVEPAPLLALDVLELGEADGPPRALELRRLLQAATAPAPTATADGQPLQAPDAGVADAPPPDASTLPLAQRLADARRRLDRLRARYLALPPGAQAALFARHAERRREQAATETTTTKAEQRAEEVSERAREEAERAAEKREQALEAARTAKSRSLRLLEQERARLHAIEEQQARHEAELSTQRAQLDADREEALAWTERVATLRKRSLREAATGGDAERLGRRVSDVLDTLHERLDESLRAVILGADTAVPLGERLDEDLLHEEHRDQLDDLWAKLARKDEQLRAQEAGIRWDRASAQRDAIVVLNRARLDALALASGAHRRRMTGLNEQAIRAAQRESRQLVLELRYHLMALPGHVLQLRAEALASPLPAVWGTVQLLIILALFIQWRRHADDLLLRARNDAQQRAVQSQATRVIAATAWYLRRIHRPLDWLVLFWAVLAIGGDLLPELRFVRLVLGWVLGASFVVLLLDAMAARQQTRVRRRAPQSALRLRSLRLLGLTVAVLGLVLSIADASVGRGTLYAWTVMICWGIALPLALLLVYWWREIIFERLDARVSADPFARTLAGMRGGLLAVPAALVGGAYLFVAGLGAWVRDELYEFEITRRLLAYVMRTQVARQSRVAAGRSGRPATRLSEVQARFFRPDAKVEHYIAYASDALSKLSQAATGEATTLTAVVGERGRGKSTFLWRLCDRMGERSLLVPCPRGGPQDLLAALCEQLELEGTPDADDIRAALQAAKTRVICIDDVQRLVRPTLDGLEHLDAVESLARSVGAGITWVLAFDAPAWSFVSRAFGDRVAFDEVIELPRWTEEQLGELIRARTEQAGLDPQFDDLMARKQLSELDEEDEERVESSFYRIIWDSADGNPAVALRYWRESLFQEESGRVAVRMFDEAPTAAVDASPLTVLFVLRSLLQMDLATQEDLIAATNLTEGQVHNALRFAQARGFVEAHDDAFRVSWVWYRVLTRILKRRRLLVM